MNLCLNAVNSAMSNECRSCTVKGRLTRRQIPRDGRNIDRCEKVDVCKAASKTFRKLQNAQRGANWPCSDTVFERTRLDQLSSRDDPLPLTPLLVTPALCSCSFCRASSSKSGNTITAHNPSSVRCTRLHRLRCHAYYFSAALDPRQQVTQFVLGLSHR